MDGLARLCVSYRSAVTGDAMKPFKVEIFSDLVCPWCYAGKRHIESALDYYRKSYPDERQPEVVWMPYQLHASIPREGVDRNEYLKRRFPGFANSSAMYDQVSKAGRAVGLEYRFDRIRVQPNSVDAHRLVRLAERQGVAEPVVESLFKAFFVEGEDISRHELLVSVAAGAGMNEAEVSAYLGGEEGAEWVRKEDARAKRRGITTVPFLVLNERKGVSGLQPADMLFEALRWARRDAARPRWLPSFI
jgi:predicted DsbA family dithiol-disulfide isomerase